MDIALFPSCLVDLLWPRVVSATRRVLQRTGARVLLPRTRPCCGQIAYNTGDRDRARHMAHIWWQEYRRFSHVVSPSGSCIAMIRTHYPELLPGATPGSAPLPNLAGTVVMELCEYLVRSGAVDRVRARFSGRLVYHPACHYVRGPFPTDAPVRCLSRVAGLNLVFPGEPDRCCGFGGIFSLVFPDMSAVIGRQKLAEAPPETDGWVSTEVGCLWHLQDLAHAAGSRLPFYHVAEVLAHDGA